MSDERLGPVVARDLDHWLTKKQMLEYAPSAGDVPLLNQAHRVLNVHYRIVVAVTAETEKNRSQQEHALPLFLLSLAQTFGIGPSALVAKSWVVHRLPAERTSLLIMLDSASLAFSHWTAP